MSLTGHASERSQKISRPSVDSGRHSDIVTDMTTNTNTTKGRLTPHQKSCYDQLVRWSARYPTGWVSARSFGCPAGLKHLADKGWADVQESIGPRGGIVRAYRPKMSV